MWVDAFLGSLVAPQSNLPSSRPVTVTNTALVNLNHDRGTLASQIPGAVIHATDVVAASAIMTTATGVASLYTVSRLRRIRVTEVIQRIRY